MMSKSRPALETQEGQCLGETRLDKVERVLRGRGVKLPLALTS